MKNHSFTGTCLIAQNHKVNVQDNFLSSTQTGVSLCGKIVKDNVDHSNSFNDVRTHNETDPKASKLFLKADNFSFNVASNNLNVKNVKVKFPANLKFQNKKIPL